MNSQITLITGASSGIGLHLAHEFARHGHPLVLIAPVEVEIQKIARELAALYKVEVLAIAKDLKLPGAAVEIFEALADEEIQVEILVNNAGHGCRGNFWNIPIEEDLSVIRLNVEAVLRLTKLFLPLMIERGSGKILNTASVAGFEPGPLMAVYHASKAFVLSWSEALAIELEGTPITVSALCPGPTDTDFFPKADMLATRAFQKANLMAPQDVAREGYQGLMNKELFIVPGGMNKILVAARRILSESAQAKVNRRLYEEVTPAERKRNRGDMELEAANKPS
jgi:short-subunit dehydrogenase